LRYYCITIAQYSTPFRPPVFTPYTIRYCALQYLVKAKGQGGLGLTRKYWFVRSVPSTFRSARAISSSSHSYTAVRSSCPGFWVWAVCVCPVWVPCVALLSGGGSSVGPSPLCGSPVWVPCVGPLCVGPLCGSPVWVPRPVALRHVASTRLMSPARSNAPAYGSWPPSPRGGCGSS